MTHPATRATLIATLLLPLALSPMANAQMDLLKLGSDLLGGGEKTATSTGAAAGLSDGDIVAGLKEALRVGSERVVGQVGRVGGFSNDSAIHIPLPESMKNVQSTLGKFGMSGMLDDLELKLNRAAEAAAPKARDLFANAIRDMTVSDARGIYNGPTDAATRYFESRMSPQLAAEMRPVVERSLSEVGAIAAYDNTMSQYGKLPLVPDVKADLTQHVLDRGLAGIFHYLAEEEAAIRSQPVARTTDLLKKVFGQ